MYKTFGELKNGDNLYHVYKSWITNKVRISIEKAEVLAFKHKIRVYNISMVSIEKDKIEFNGYFADLKAVLDAVGKGNIPKESNSFWEI